MNRFFGQWTSGLLVVALLCCVSCSSESQQSYSIEGDAEFDRPAVAQPFDVYWPLIDPMVAQPAATRRLLAGQLTVLADNVDQADPRLGIRLSLLRDDDEESRRYWNSALEYREYNWMKRVRVWDTGRRWLYPNLSFLFKLHGVDRLDRYGGWDKGHAVDNDFGAVLIRSFDSTGRTESASTADKPLVSAAWHAGTDSESTRRTVVHRADSDTFVVHLLDVPPPCRGQVKVWFVYGDFMNHPVPDTWPAEPDSDGGSLAYFQIDWQCEPGAPIDLQIAQQTPEATRFDWRRWVGRSDEETMPTGRARLENL